MSLFQNTTFYSGEFQFSRMEMNFSRYSGSIDRNRA